MRKFFLLIFFTKLFLAISFCQERFDLKNLTNEISILNQSILKQAKKQKFTVYESQIFHIFRLNYEGLITKDEFISHHFLNNLYPTFIQKTKYFKKTKILSTDGLLCDKDGNLIALTDGRFVYRIDTSTNLVLLRNKLIAELLFKNEIDYCFYINGTPSNNYFCIKNNEIFVISINDNKKLLFCPLKDFIEQNWDEFTKHKYLINKSDPERSLIL